MPDFDSGHIFLTTMAPIKLGAPESAPQNSYEQTVRTILAMLPTAKQSPETFDNMDNSPFSRNRYTHLARMFVLENVVYNGRKPENAIIGQIRGSNPTIPQKTDTLTTPYVVFCADIDAVTSEGAALPKNLSKTEQEAIRAHYAMTLWETMEEEIKAIYSNCYGFEDVDSSEKFAAYLNKCHVETTMPFHDYYLNMPKLSNLPLLAMIRIAVVPLIFGVFALALWLFGKTHIPLLGWPSLVSGLIGLCLFGIVAYLSYLYIMRNGNKPFPPGEYDDLPSVLKSIYIQQKFTKFYENNQGSNADKLYENFGKFLAEHKPSNKFQMTQKPGVISSHLAENIIKTGAN